MPKLSIRSVEATLDLWRHKGVPYPYRASAFFWALERAINEEENTDKLKTLYFQPLYTTKSCGVTWLEERFGH